jgi:hypothetical protein
VLLDIMLLMGWRELELLERIQYRNPSRRLKRG